MIGIIVLFLATALKYFEVFPIFAEISWWWIIGLAGVLFIWFDFLERMLGLDKRKSDAHYDKMQKERVKRAFAKDKNKR
jgi:small Trp-rich protein